MSANSRCARFEDDKRREMRSVPFYTIPYKLALIPFHLSSCSRACRYGIVMEHALTNVDSCLLEDRALLILVVRGRKHASARV